MGFPLVATERLALVEFLETLGPDDWAVPSLCPGWTVRDVVAHLTSVVEAGPLDMARAAVAGYGMPARVTRVLADRWSARDPDELVAGLRAQVDNTFAPPGLGYRASLTDVMVHRLDIAVPLARSVERPADSWLPVLEFLTSQIPMLGSIRGGRPALTFSATDLDWSAGTGPRVSGPAEALGLTLSGRPALLDQLDGDGVPALRQWLAT